MVIDFNRTLAYRCASCGEFSYGNFSLFELSGEKGISLQCSCGHSGIEIVPENKTNFIVSVRCLLCDEIHRYTMPFASLVKKNCIEFTCPSVVIGLVYIGREEIIKKSVLENEKYIEEIVSACGLEHAGKNGITMLKALDKIQELSDEENLYCTCGSKLIDIEVHEDSLTLECCLCGASLVFTADDIRNGDFSHIDKLILSNIRK